LSESINNIKNVNK